MGLTGTVAGLAFTMDLLSIVPPENETRSPLDEINADIGTAMTLDKVEIRQIVRVSGFAGGSENLVARLREIGFAEDDEVELLYRGPFARKPLCFRLNRTMVALRPNEACAIEVEVLK